MANIYVGIDPGIVSGYAEWNSDTKQFIEISGIKIFQLFDKLDIYTDPNNMDFIHVRIEDPNTWQPFSRSSYHENSLKIQGAGAVKQTFKHIIEYLEYYNVKHTKIRLTSVRKKVKATEFIKITGWQKPTNEHGRDAAMLVYDF